LNEIMNEIAGGSEGEGGGERSDASYRQGMQKNRKLLDCV
jgi:hypothetical protein